ncbi:hypothetical protein LCGC14_0512500 [marine sediment metagenome]|uniref:Uncharacterized protein n=1 Tax=marine sediment metagenome TaxID=412755 RepID=A0A0F9V994_9ZZZZ|nr:MAG: hypothetical protein Lokiarch_04840 [Candidatus Lokiarchaeum sp. GC14_75]
MIKKLSLFDIFNPKRSKKSLKELKETLQLNPDYFKEVEKIKLEREFLVVNQDAWICQLYI